MDDKPEQEVPQPLVPAEIDLRGLTWMPLDTQRLLDSELFATSSAEGFRGAVALWCRAWQQVPAGSLPNDEKRLAMMSNNPGKWKRIRSEALRGFVLCSDGRLYHPVIARKAMETWEFRERQRAKAAGRWGKDPGLFPGDAAAYANRQDKTGQDKTGGTTTPLPPFVLPDWVPSEAWEGYVEWRQRVRKPLTPYAKKLALKDLERLRAAGHDPAEVLNQSPRRGWLGLFPVKKDEPPASAPRGKQAAIEARNEDAARQWVEGKKL